jgi:hypothetical protein
MNGFLMVIVYIVVGHYNLLVLLVEEAHHTRIGHLENIIKNVGRS